MPRLPAALPAGLCALFAFALLPPALAPLAGPAHASNANFGQRAFVNINQEGTRRCNALGASGYTATASGTGAGVGPGSGAFQIRTCFATRAECEDFIANLRRHASSIDTIRHRACRPSG